jgi:predicted DNA-binding protein with PD1-like motif
MSRVNRSSVALTAVLFLMAIAPASRAQQTTSDYLAPAQAIPHGKAPGMKVQLLTDSGAIKEYAVIFAEGDEAFSGMLAFAEQYHVTSAHFTAIGGVQRATLGWFDSQREMFKKIPIDSQVEVLSMIGDIAMYKGKPVVHAHMVVGTSDGSARGGHLLEAIVWPTLEVFVTVDPVAMQKAFDPQTRLTLIAPGPQ